MQLRFSLLLVVSAVLAATPAAADPPPWAGGGAKEHHDKGKGKGKGHDREAHGEPSRESRERHFSDAHHVAVREYYDRQYRRGKCPPGLAKKHNGCMPPGQARKWRLGRPLPRDVVIYALPQPVLVKLGPPPPGDRFVRVGADILLITIGTGIVIDAIQDLGRG
jgi:Ni/Co efflux regulator RcnB